MPTLRRPGRVWPSGPRCRTGPAPGCGVGPLAVGLAGLHTGGTQFSPVYWFDPPGKDEPNRPPLNALRKTVLTRV